LFVILSDEKHVDLILNKINFFDFLLFMQKNTKNDNIYSFIISSSINENKKSEKFNNTWNFFYLLFKYFVNGNESYFHLKIMIMKLFVKEILKFYRLKKDQKIFNKNNIYNMNYCLIDILLKIIKKLIVVNSLEACFPYDYNIQKFEMLEKINILAEEVFYDSEFDFSDFFSSRKLNENEKYYPESRTYTKEIDNIIESNQNSNIISVHPARSYIEVRKSIFPISDSNLNQQSESKICSLGAKNIGHIQFNILDLLGDFYCTSNLNLYFQIINLNIENFDNFLLNPESFHKHTIGKTKYDFKLHLIILKFLTNFLTIKHYNFSEINLVSDIEISKNELYQLGCQNKKFFVDTNIDNNILKIPAKYLIYKIRYKILDILKKYLKNACMRNPLNDNPKNDSLGSTKNCFLGYFFINKFSLLLKYFYLKNEEGKILDDYLKEFFNLLDIFFQKESLMKFFEIKIDFKLEVKEVLEDKEEIEFEFYNYIQYFSQLIKELNSKDKLKQITDNIEINRLIPSFYGIKLNNEYFIDFLKDYFDFDDQPESIYNNKIKIYLSINHKKWESIKKDELEEYKNDKNLDKEKKSILTILIYLKNLKWSPNIKKKYTSDEIPEMMEYFFNYLNILLQVHSENVSSVFSVYFSENFLRIINYLNNFLYYSPSKIQQYLQTNDSIFQLSKKLLRYLIKLNNYIIGISEYEFDKNLISLCKIYFTLMDLFILLGEGVHVGNVIDILFMDLSNKENEHNSESDHLDQANISYEGIKNNHANFDEKNSNLNFQFQEFVKENIHSSTNFKTIDINKTFD